MGGQACVVYGAAEFSRDVDLALLAEPVNLASLSGALDELDAVPIAVPTLDLESEPVDVLALPDLVPSKKTQRDKDWPMLRRLVEVEYVAARESPTPAQIDFWFAELRSPELLVEHASRRPRSAREFAARPAVAAAIAGDRDAAGRALDEERIRIRDEDRAYWQPLRLEIEQARRPRRA